MCGKKFESKIFIAFELIAIELLHHFDSALWPIVGIFDFSSDLLQLLLFRYLRDPSAEGGIVGACGVEGSGDGREEEPLVVDPAGVVDAEELVVAFELQDGGSLLHFLLFL